MEQILKTQALSVCQARLCCSSDVRQGFHTARPKLLFALLPPASLPQLKATPPVQLLKLKQKQKCNSSLPLPPHISSDSKTCRYHLYTEPQWDPFSPQHRHVPRWRQLALLQTALSPLLTWQQSRVGTGQNLEPTCLHSKAGSVTSCVN